MYIVGHRLTYCNNFGEFRINRFFSGVQNRITVPMESNYIRSMLVSKRCFQLITNFPCALYIAVPHTILILVCAEGIVFLTEYTKCHTLQPTG